MENQRDILAKKQQLLAEKQRELELLKQRSAKRGHLKAANSPVTSDSSHVTSTKSVPEALGNIEAFGNKSRPDDTTQEYNRGRTGMPGTHDLQTDRSPPTSIGSALSTPQNTPPDRMEHRTPSTSKKRYSSIIEAKHRQLVEEEGLAFRASQARLHSNEGEGTHTHIHTVLWHCLHTNDHIWD